MRTIKLTRQEKAIEEALLRGEFKSVNKKEFNEIAESLNRRRKDAVLNIRVNRYDLETLKQKAAKIGVGYQTFISEMLHKIAQA